MQRIFSVPVTAIVQVPPLAGTNIGLTQTRVRIVFLTHGGIVLAAPTSIVFISGAADAAHINPPHTNQQRVDSFLRQNDIQGLPVATVNTETTRV